MFTGDRLALVSILSELIMRPNPIEHRREGYSIRIRIDRMYVQQVTAHYFSVHQPSFPNFTVSVQERRKQSSTGSFTRKQFMMEPVDLSIAVKAVNGRCFEIAANGWGKGLTSDAFDEERYADTVIRVPNRIKRCERIAPSWVYIFIAWARKAVLSVKSEPKLDNIDS